MRVDLLEHGAGSPSEFERATLVGDGEAPDGDTVDALDAFGQLVTPGDVVARAGREDFDLRVAREPFRDVTRVQLGPAADVGAVTLNDDGELHDSFGSPVPRSAGSRPAAG